MTVAKGKNCKNKRCEHGFITIGFREVTWKERVFTMPDLVPCEDCWGDPKFRAFGFIEQEGEQNEAW